MEKISQTYRMMLNEVRISNRSGSHVNCIRVFKNNTNNHELGKFLVCMKLLKQNKDFITEAILENGSRVDVLCLSDGIGYEVLETETEQELSDKIKKYPESILIIGLKAKDIIEGKFEI